MDRRAPRRRPPGCRSIRRVNLIWFRPFSLNLFYEKIFVSFLLEQPELLTSLGIAEQFGYRRHNAHLDDASVAKTERDFAAWHRYLDSLKAYDAAAQTPEQQTLHARVDVVHRKRTRG